MATELVRYDAARKALAEARRIDEVKTIRDKAEAMQHYAKQAKDRVLIAHATEIRMRAEDRAGELLAEMKANKQRDPGHRPKKIGSQAATQKVPKLADLGVSKTQSSRWQQFHALPAEEKEKKIAAAVEKADAAIEAASKQTRKTSPRKHTEPLHVRLGNKIVIEIGQAIKPLLPKERRWLIDMLRLNVDALEKKYAPPA